jgi:hypothetical protein
VLPEPGLNPDLVRPPDRAVLLLVRADADPTLRPEAADLLASGTVSPYEVWDRAGSHQVLPAVARLIASEEVGRVLDSRLVGAAQVYRRKVLAVNLVQHAELKAIIQALSAAGIPAVPLKGTYLAERYYGGLDGRLSGDVDILVPAELVEGARKVLGNLGFQPAPESSPARVSHPFHDPAYVRPSATGWTVVELHRGLTDPRFVKVNYGRLWAGVRRLSGAGFDWPAVLPPEEELLFLAVHLPKHDTGILRLLADIDRAIRHHGPQFDWAALIDLAVDWQAAVMLYFGLERARVFLGTPVPERVLVRLRPARWRRLAVNWLAGPEAILSQARSDNIRTNRFRLAYCAMLTPTGKAFQACSAYFFAPEPGSDDRRLTAILRGIARLAATIFGSRPGSQTGRRISTFTQLVLNRLTTSAR